MVCLFCARDYTAHSTSTGKCTTHVGGFLIVVYGEPWVSELGISTLAQSLGGRGLEIRLSAPPLTLAVMRNQMQILTSLRRHRTCFLSLMLLPPLTLWAKWTWELVGTS